MQLYDELVARGLIAQVTDEDEIKEMINNGKAVFYIGFDPTADSLHVGHFMALCLMKRLQMAGNRPIALIGGGTAMIGDPSGKTDMRQMMTVETIQHNCECFKKQMSRFIEFGEGKAMMVNNADWLMDLNYIDVLREVGPHFSVNRMLTAECYKQRMEKGLSFLEFNYMIMQSYDFYKLFQDYDCNLAIGQQEELVQRSEVAHRSFGYDDCNTCGDKGQSGNRERENQECSTNLEERQKASSQGCHGAGNHRASLGVGIGSVAGCSTLADRLLGDLFALHFELLARRASYRNGKPQNQVGQQECTEYVTANGCKTEPNGRKARKGCNQQRNEYRQTNPNGVDIEVAANTRADTTQLCTLHISVEAAGDAGFALCLRLVLGVALLRDCISRSELGDNIFD